MLVGCFRCFSISLVAHGQIERGDSHHKGNHDLFFCLPFPTSRQRNAFFEYQNISKIIKVIFSSSHISIHIRTCGPKTIWKKANQKKKKHRHRSQDAMLKARNDLQLAVTEARQLPRVVRDSAKVKRHDVLF